MSDPVFKLNYEGVGKLLKSEFIRNELQRHVNDTLSSLGPGYIGEVYTEKTRCVGEVRASSFEAKKDNSENNSLLKALR
jgi:hypothetical protein